MVRLIEEDMPVTYKVVDRDYIPEGIDLTRLPEDVSILSYKSV